MRRGFKTWCENVARGYRRDLGLPRHVALDPRQLANHLNIVIWSPAEIPGLDRTVVRQVLKTDPSSWSAVTLTVGERTAIIANTSHSSVRQNSSLTHELSHIILKHDPVQVFVTAEGNMMMKHYEASYEEEAAWLSGTLLVPRAGLLYLLVRNYSDARMAEHFRVSADLLRMRKNVTGVTRQLRSGRR